MERVTKEVNLNTTRIVDHYKSTNILYTNRQL